MHFSAQKFIESGNSAYVNVASLSARPAGHEVNHDSTKWRKHDILRFSFFRAFVIKP
jgi:hypothetical protein